MELNRVAARQRMIMKITVRARPGAKSTYIKKMESPLLGERDGPEFVVAVKEPAKEGRANRAIEKMIAEFFGVPQSRVRIVAGHASRTKVVEIKNEG